MRGLRAFAIALLAATLSVPLLASSAMGDSFHRDPDDTATSFDIRAVRTVSHPPSRTLRLSATFYDDLQWSHHTFVWFYLDSRAGPLWDFYVHARPRHGVPQCLLYPRDGSLWGPVGANFGPRRVTCRVNMRLLSPTHTIRYGVRALSLVTDPHRHEVSDSHRLLSPGIRTSESKGSRGGEVSQARLTWCCGLGLRWEGGDVRDDAQARPGAQRAEGARASWLVGVSVREYRELEAGTKYPDYDAYDRVCELFGWPRSFTH